MLSTPDDGLTRTIALRHCKIRGNGDVDRRSNIKIAKRSSQGAKCVSIMICARAVERIGLSLMPEHVRWVEARLPQSLDSVDYPVVISSTRRPFPDGCASDRKRAQQDGLRESISNQGVSQHAPRAAPVSGGTQERVACPIAQPIERVEIEDRPLGRVLGLAVVTAVRLADDEKYRRIANLAALNRKARADTT